MEFIFFPSFFFFVMWLLVIPPPRWGISFHCSRDLKAPEPCGEEAANTNNLPLQQEPLNWAWPNSFFPPVFFFNPTHGPSFSLKNVINQAFLSECKGTKDTFSSKEEVYNERRRGKQQVTLYCVLNVARGLLNVKIYALLFDFLVLSAAKKVCSGGNQESTNTLRLFWSPLFFFFF